jgi:hypothetical protein
MSGDVAALLRSLQVQAALEKVHFALYWAARAPNVTLSKYYQTQALTSHLLIKRVVCETAVSEAELINCAAERCFADLHHYVYAARAAFKLVGHKWARAVAKEMKSRGDLGAVQVVVSVGANTYPSVVVGR